jgi:hypothetical protein
LTCREPIRGSQESYAIDARAVLERPYRHLLAVPTLWWIILSGASVNFGAYAFNTFLPALMIRYHHVNVAKAGGASAIVLGVTGLAGLSLGGWVADKLHAVFPRGRLLWGAYSLLLASPLLWFGLARPSGDVTGAVTLLALGWLLYFMYFVTVYASIQDVVEPRLRATAMSVYFFFQYVLGAGFGTVVTGALSDYYAKQAMRAAGAEQMTEAMRASGLQASLALVIPLSTLITGVALWFASSRFVADAARASQGVPPKAGAPAKAGTSATVP